MTERPIVAVTMGDPAGVGPEVAVKALVREEVWACCRPLIVGDVAVLARAAKFSGNPVVLRAVATLAEARFEPTELDVLDLCPVDLTAVRMAEVSATAGRASVADVEQATELELNRQVGSIVTGPINKAALQAAGCPYVGHTELLAELTGAERVTTMLATQGLRVVHVTRHVALRGVAAHITCERVLETIHLTDAGLREMGIVQPRIAVAALNPHAGDGGLVGREEIEEIGPAVKAARGDGVDAQGPITAPSAGPGVAQVCFWRRG